MNLACIPAYNEENKIADVIKKSLLHVDQVVVCDDGSTDDTAKIAKSAGAVVISQSNQGYGAALSTLFDYARQNDAKIMVTLDSDGQHDPEQIPLLLDAITTHGVDVSVGSRFLGDSEASGYRKAGIKIITSAANYGTNLKVSDSQSGFRAYSQKAIDAIHPTEQGMSVSTEILLKISNKKDVENNRLRFFIGDVRDYKRLDMAMKNINYVVHAAALSAQMGKYRDFHRANVQSTENIIQAAKSKNIEKETRYFNL